MNNDSRRIREFIDLAIAIGAWVAFLFAVLMLLRRFVIPHLSI